MRLPVAANAGSIPGTASGTNPATANPLGRGFARHWYLDAQQLATVPAPRIFYPKQPCTAEQFWQGAAGKDLPPPAGLAPIGRGWLPRRALAGSIREKEQWDQDEVPMLPEDFDFAYWNCTPPDQQCAHLAGLEQFTLTNLCRHDHPSARADRIGNTVLRFALPQQVLFLLLADAHDQLLVLRLKIDTVLIDTDAGTVELVWRAIVPADAGQVAARLMHVSEPEQIARVALLEQAQEALAGAAPMTNETVTKSARFYCVSLTPDICKTPGRLQHAAAALHHHRRIFWRTKCLAQRQVAQRTGDPAPAQHHSQRHRRRAGQGRRHQERHGRQAGRHQGGQPHPPRQRRRPGAGGPRSVDECAQYRGQDL